MHSLFKTLTFFILATLSIDCFSQQNKFNVSSDIEVNQLTSNTFVHTSWVVSEQYGRFSANGLIFINNGKAYLFDSPVNDSLTKNLCNWIEDSLHAEIKAFVPNHWHIDCMGGLNFIKSIGIKTYANQKTIEIAQKQGLPLPETGFKDSLIIDADGIKILCIFPGEAHATDNIAVWIESEKVLFPGCIIKELASSNLGNTKDGNLTTYAATIELMLKRFSSARHIVPGHGKWGDLTLVHHTLKMANQNK